MPANIKPFITQKAEYTKYMEKIAHVDGKHLVDMHERLRLMSEKKASWETQGFDDLKKAYDRATKTPIISAGKDEFREFWEVPIYGFSKDREDM